MSEARVSVELAFVVDLLGLSKQKIGSIYNKVVTGCHEAENSVKKLAGKKKQRTQTLFQRNKEQNFRTSHRSDYFRDILAVTIDDNNITIFSSFH